MVSKDSPVIRTHSGDHQAHMEVNFFLTVVFLEMANILSRVYLLKVLSVPNECPGLFNVFV